MIEVGERFLSVAEITAKWGVSERSVRALIASGRLPVVRPAGLRLVRVPQSAVERVMQGEGGAEAGR